MCGARRTRAVDSSHDGGHSMHCPLKDEGARVLTLQTEKSRGNIPGVFLCTRRDEKGTGPGISATWCKSPRSAQKLSANSSFLWLLFQKKYGSPNKSASTVLSLSGQLENSQCEHLSW